MAGTLFAVEILLFDLEVASLSNIVIASVTGTVVSKAFWSNETIFQIPFFTLTLGFKRNTPMVTHPLPIFSKQSISVCLRQAPISISRVVMTILKPESGPE